MTLGLKDFYGGTLCSLCCYIFDLQLVKVIVIIIRQLYELYFVVYVSVMFYDLHIYGSDFLVVFQKILRKHVKKDTSIYLREVTLNLLWWEMYDRNCMAVVLLRRMGVRQV